MRVLVDECLPKALRLAEGLGTLEKMIRDIEAAVARIIPGLSGQYHDVCMPTA